VPDLSSYLAALFLFPSIPCLFRMVASFLHMLIMYSQPHSTHVTCLIGLALFVSVPVQNGSLCVILIPSLKWHHCIVYHPLSTILLPSAQPAHRNSKIPHCQECSEPGHPSSHPSAQHGKQGDHDALGCGTRHVYSVNSRTAGHRSMRAPSSAGGIVHVQ
jgi:hypothetical protein